MRILIAEDQRDLNQLLKKRLKEAGYSVDACFDGAAVFDYLLRAEYDALVLDIMMPKVDGIQVVRRLRREGNQVPVLLLTARDSIEDRVAGLDAGADDYLIKPFAFEELLARLRVLLRKPQGARPPCCGWGSWSSTWTPARCSARARRCASPPRSSPCCGT